MNSDLYQSVPQGYHETELIIKLLKQFTNPHENLSNIPLKNVDWPLFYKLVKNHGVLPQIACVLNRTGHINPPDSILKAISDEARLITNRSLLMSSELIILYKTFKEKDIPFIPFKGPLLANLLYNNVAMREQCDLDFFIQKRDVKGVKQVLLSLGYQYEESTTFEQRFLMHQHKYYHSGKNIVLEVQWKFNQEYFLFHLPFKELCENLMNVDFHNTEISTLNIDDMLLVLFVHGSRHYWNQFKWIMDIAMIIRNYPQIRWEQVLMKAHRKNVLRMALVGLNLARTILSVDLDRRILGYIENDSKVLELSEEIKKSLFLLEPSHKIRIYLRLMNSIRGKIHFAAYGILTPKERDRAVIRLPDFLHLAYYIIRPFRISIKYLAKFVALSKQKLTAL